MNDIPLLSYEDIEVKIQKVGKGGAVAVLYKTARIDMSMLDKVFGAENWTDEYTEIKGNLYCTIRVKFGSEWIGKQDCGIESRDDGEGNQKKGEASDAFKRAAVKWGIGRELYSAPFIFLRIETDIVPETADYPDYKKKYRVKNRFESYSVSEIGYDANKRIDRLEISTGKGIVVFSFGKTKTLDKEAQKKKDAAKSARETMVSQYCTAHKLNRAEFMDALSMYSTVAFEEIEFMDLQRYIIDMERDSQ